MGIRRGRSMLISMREFVALNIKLLGVVDYTMYN